MTMEQSSWRPAGRRSPLQDDDPDEQRHFLGYLLLGHMDAIQAGSRRTAQDLAPLRPPLDLVDDMYSRGNISAKSWAYLALTLRLIDVYSCQSSGSLDRIGPERLWGYISFAVATPEERKRFEEEVLPSVLGTGQPVPVSAGPRQDLGEDMHPYKQVATNCLRRCLYDGDHAALRIMVNWLHSAYEPYHQRLLHSSSSPNVWLENAAELMPRLLLRNLFPIHNQVRVRPPGLYISSGPDDGGPRGLHDPGTEAQTATIYRNLFTEDEIRFYEQASQRMSEIFAHTFSLLWCDLDQEVRDRSSSLIELGHREGRLRALQRLEVEYRHRLSMPTYEYRRLKPLLRLLPSTSAPHAEGNA